MIICLFTALWCEGPKFLLSKCEFSNDKLDLLVQLSEMDSTKATQDKVVITTSVPHDCCRIFSNYSDIGKMTRKLAYVHWFCHNVNVNVV